MTLIRPRTLILSPYAGDIHRNVQYAKDCLKDSIDRGEAPFASHLLYTQVLYDGNLEERKVGFECEYAFAWHCNIIAMYTDLGISPGMEQTLTSICNMPLHGSVIHRLVQRRLGGVWAEVANA